MPRIILVGGGSSSGKTYVTKAVLDALGSDNFNRISMDDYYKCHTNLSMEERAALNYDHPKAFDWKLMREQVKALKNGQAIDKPIYDFVTHDRLPETERVEPSKVIVLEGIMALVYAEIREMGDIKIFINASPERRFLRRLLRDSNERGRSFESIVNQYFATVAPMYGEIVEPSKQYADIIVNNDGVENHAVDVLASLFLQQIDLFDMRTEKIVLEKEVFNEEALASAFTKKE